MEQHDARVHGEKDQDDCGHGTDENKHAASNWAEQLWKSLVAKSICDAFRKMGLFIQNNNTGLMHQSRIGMSIWLNEEPVIIDCQQELYLN